MILIERQVLREVAPDEWLWLEDSPSLHDLARDTAKQISNERLRRAARRAFPSGWWHGAPFWAGSWDDDAIIDFDRDEYRPGRLKVPCPSCRRTIAPLLSRSCLVIDSGWRWVGLDHQQPETDYLSVCPRCHWPVLFQICTPQ